MTNASTMSLAPALIASIAAAAPVVSTYDDLAEAFYGQTWTYDGITYHDVNTHGGVFPNRDMFTADDPGSEIIVENATLFYNEFPAWGSATNALTFGRAFITGDNLSLGALVSVTMDLPDVADAASVDVAYYENGPWIGIQYHLDAYRNGALVASDGFTIGGTDPNGRDNIALNALSVGGAEFDQLVLYATFGNDYSAPRIIMDDLSVNYIPAPGVALAFLGLARRRRR
ncbi:MAG: hypothetical protein KDA28_07060 [Phycisphaerales bacterium]|nr:hypothetical protein [Phycisphaerales bacterium]